MSLAVGIDLGTTFSVISVYKDGQVQIIPNKYGNRTTPSIVAYDYDNNVYVGESALDMASMIPHQNIIYTVKRHVGSNKRFVINDLEFSPEIVSSEILKYLKSCAEEYLGEEVTDAVITVPAYFNNDQRNSTKIAGEYAGLNVLRIINEPTAASLAYGLNNKKDSTILVYDLGGGTFDVTLLKLTDEVDFHVLATSGNTKLGGIDFDKKIYDYVLEKFYKSNLDIDHSYTLNEVQKNKLLECCEKAKKALSISSKSIVNLPYITLKNLKLCSIHEIIEKKDFDNLILPLVNLTKENIDQVLSDANLTIDKIDEVVFVGGSTRIPLVYEKVLEWTGKKPNKNINPDEAVAIGAGLQASVLSGSNDKELFLIDVTPLSLGIETQGGVMSVMIKRNTQIPTEYIETFTTAVDNQTSVDVKVYQGERPQTVNNYYLGEFTLNNIPPVRRGIPKIEVLFKIDANGILTVKAQDVESCEQKELILDNKSFDNLDINKILKDAENNKISDAQFIEINKLKSWLIDYSIQISELLETNILSASEINELNDLKISIDMDLNSQNIEFLNSLVHSSKELIEKYSDKVYEKAKEIIK